MQDVVARSRAVIATSLLLAAACGFFSHEGGATMTLRLTSPSFEHEKEIPIRHTCEGADVSPPLAWSGLPAGTQSLALIVDDPDAPDPRAPKKTWVHWVVYDIPPNTTALSEGAALPPGARDGRNDWKVTGFRGPCPPIGRHRYFHKLYALDVMLRDLGEPDKAALEAAMKGHILGEATLIGTYAKRGDK
jgi:Raf kinase inhibitor-like YbhB/YbcL family protein